LSWPRVSINSSLPRWDSTAYLCSFLVREALSFSKREIVSSPCETLIRATSFVSVKGGGMDFLFYFFSLIFKTTTFSALKYTIQLHPPSPMHLPSTSLTPPHVSASRASLPSPLTTQAADIWYGTSITNQPLSWFESTAVSQGVLFLEFHSIRETLDRTILWPISSLFVCFIL
jgi:hypothetical protein